MLENVIAWLPISISVLALLVTATFSWTNLIDRRTSARLNREKDLHSWAMQIAEVYVLLLSGSDEEKRKALIRLSVLIDYGRLMFPNERTPRALRKYEKGLRSSVLDPLVETCKRGTQGDWEEAELAKDWRHFTDELTARTTAFAINTSPESEGKAQYRSR